MRAIHRATLGVVLGLSYICTWGAGAQAPFNRDLREKLSFLQQRGAERVQLHVVARQGKNAELAAQIERRGGTIRFRADEIDYLRVSFPLGDMQGIDALLALAALEAMTPSYFGQRLDPGVRIPAREVAEGSEPATPLMTPYRPIVDLDGLEWQQRNPTFDGRGVGVAMLDGIPDLLHPNLQRALDLQGRWIPKHVDVQYTGNFTDDRTDTYWIQMKTPVQATGHRVLHGGREYIAPYDGAFRLELLPRPTAFGRGTQVPVAPADGGDPSKLPVLWDRATDTVWVDTNVDSSFADERPLQPYQKRGDFGVIGRDDPATRLRESIAFTISIDREAEALRFNPAWGVHGTAVAGAAVAEGMNWGSFDGLAGKAQLGSYEISGLNDAYNVPETIYLAMKDPRIDLVFYEWNNQQIGDYTLRDGRNAISIAIDRAAAYFKKPLFVPASNVPGLMTVAEPSVPRHAISVGAYDSREALRVNFAVDSPYRDNHHAAGSFGPAGNGALKPDLMAPAGHITTNVMSSDDLPRRLLGHMQLPPAYRIGGGTSCATPTAAGAAALLISAAKQENVKWDEERLRFAMYSTARPMEDTPSYQQGRGLIQIGRAWEALKALDKIAGWTAPQIDVDAPVRTTSSHLLPTPHRGVGLYEREGWRPNQRGKREIVFTRRNGPSAPVTYQLEWQGDVSAFTSAKALTLPLNKPVALPVNIATRESRIYSAILRLKEPGMPVESLSLLATIVAAHAPAANEQYTFKQTLTVRRPGVESLLVYVSPGTTALQTTIAKDSAENISVYHHSPDVDRFESGPQVGKGRAHTVIQNPGPGVWEILLYNRAMLRDYGKLEDLQPRPSPMTPTAVNVEVKLLRTAVEPTGGETVTLSNTGAPIEGKALWSNLGSALEQPVTLRSGAQHTFTLNVPKGARLLKTQFDGLSDADAEVTLIAYQMVGSQAVKRQIVRGASGIPLVARIADPAPGEWRIVLDPYSLPAGEVKGTYRDLVVHDAYGGLKVQSDRFTIATGDQWRAAVTATPLARPLPPRRLVGVISLGVRAGGQINDDETAPQSFGEAVLSLEAPLLPTDHDSTNYSAPGRTQ